MRLIIKVINLFNIEITQNYIKVIQCISTIGDINVGYS